MNKLVIVGAVAVAMIAVVAGAALQERSIPTASGTTILTVPQDWPSLETQHHARGVTTYRLGPANTNFVIELRVNDPLLNKTNALLDGGLESFIESICSLTAKTSVEGKIVSHRFGGRRDGVYARFTDKRDNSGPFRYLTRGVRLVGTNVVAFALVSNDADFSALSNTLAIVESVRIEGSK